MPRKYKKKTDRQKLMDEADALARALVRSRGYCQAAGLDDIKCSSSETLQWCHIVGRNNKRLKHELWNALCMCSGHHVYYTHHPWEWKEFIQIHFPANYELIEAHRLEKWDKDLEGTIERLKATPMPEREEWLD